LTVFHLVPDRNQDIDDFPLVDAFPEIGEFELDRHTASSSSIVHTAIERKPLVLRQIDCTGYYTPQKTPLEACS
jgi:hypothetical protein